MHKRVPIALVALLVLIFGCIAWQVWRRAQPDYVTQKNTVYYRNKSLESWFFGSRTNFLSKTARDAAQQALDGVGTNAFPFLILQLTSARGTPELYGRVHRAMPGWVQKRLPYPLSANDIKGIALQHLWTMSDRIPRQDLHALARCLPRLRNARLRMRVLILLNRTYQVDPGFLKLCRELLNDPEPAIRLEAAIPLGESGLTRDPAEPKLFPILISAFESKDIRSHWADINGYYIYRQARRVSGRTNAMLISALFPSITANPPDVVRRRIETALIRLEPYLTQEQIARFRQAVQKNRNSAQEPK